MKLPGQQSFLVISRQKTFLIRIIDGIIRKKNHCEIHIFCVLENYQEFCFYVPFSLDFCRQWSVFCAESSHSKEAT